MSCILFSVEESWKMTEPEKVAALVRDVGLWRLGNWDGCCCSAISIRGVDIDISCGKGREQGVWISSNAFDYADNQEALLKPVMDEVIKQLNEDSGRAPMFLQHFYEWKADG